MSHENIDVVVTIVNFINEFAAMGAEPENEDNMKLLFDIFIKKNFFEALFLALKRFKENQSEEYDAVHKTLTILENMIDFNAEYSISLCKNTKIINWLLARIQPGFKVEAKVIDDNQLYSCEILSILL